MVVGGHGVEGRDVIGVVVRGGWGELRGQLYVCMYMGGTGGMLGRERAMSIVWEYGDGVVGGVAGGGWWCEGDDG